MSTVMNFVCVLGAILIFCLCVCGAFFLYFLIKHGVDTCGEKKETDIDSMHPSPFRLYNYYGVPFSSHDIYSPNRVAKVALDSDVEKVRERVSKLETLLEYDDNEIDITIPEEFQNLHDEVEVLTRRVNELENEVNDINDIPGKEIDEKIDEGINKKLEDFKKRVNESVFNANQTAQKAIDNSEYAKGTISSYREYFLDFSTRLESLEMKNKEKSNAS